MTHRALRGVAAVLLFASAATARAASIGVNFTGGGNGSSPAIGLLATDSAGVVPQTNYNNVAGGSGTNLALIDNTGAATIATLTYTSNGSYSSIGGAAIAPAGGDEKLNTGFIYSNAAATVTVSGVPYTRYDVYVYMLNDAAGRVETTSLTAGGPAQTFYGASAVPNDAGHVDQNAGTAYVYTQTTSTNSASPTPAGDYVVFSGLTSPSFQFTTSAPGNAYLNGFQIVQNVPEPAILGLLGVTSVAALARRRRTV